VFFTIEGHKFEKLMNEIQKSQHFVEDKLAALQGKSLAEFEKEVNSNKRRSYTFQKISKYNYTFQEKDMSTSNSGVQETIASACRELGKLEVDQWITTPGTKLMPALTKVRSFAEEAETHHNY